MAESVQYFDLNILADSLTGKIKLSNACKDSPYWDGWYPRLRVAVLVIFLLYYVFVVPGLCLLARKRSSNARSILKLGFWLAVVQVVVALLLGIVGDSLLNCHKIGSVRYLKIYVGLNVLKVTSSITILAVVCFNLIPTITTVAGSGSAKLSRLIHLVLAVLVCFFAVIFQTLYNYNNIHRVAAGKLVDQNYGTYATYAILYLVWTLSASAFLLMAAGKVKSRAVLLFSTLVAVSLIGFALIDFIVIYGWLVVTRTWNRNTSTVFGILSLFFQSNTYFGIIAIAYMLTGSRHEAVEEQDKGRNGTNGTH